MTTVFIAGSISISRLHAKVQERINKVVSSDHHIVVGDADGADTSIQECLRAYHASKVTVYCTGEMPRNNIADWPVHHVQSKAQSGTRAFFTAKDVEMAKNSDFGLMVWDCKSTGTLNNVIELLKAKKKSVVFVNKNKDFMTIGDRSGLDHLLHFMSDHARAKAEEKIGLSAKIAALGQDSFLLDAPAANVSEDLLDAPTADGPVETTADTTDAKSEVLTLASVGDAIEDTPAEAENMKLRSTLIRALEAHIRTKGLSQTQAAKLFGVTQPRVSDLLRGKINLFALDTLVNMAGAAGLHVEMRVLEAA